MSSSDPRVLVVAPRLDLGGVEVHLLRVLPRLRRLGLDVSIFTIEPGGRLDVAFEAAGIPVLGTCFKGPRPLRALRAANALRRELSKRRPNILHFFLTEPYVIGVIGSAGAGRFKKIMSRRSLANYQRNYPFVGAAERLMHGSMAALIGNSVAVGKELVSECGQSRKVGIIHNGIEVREDAAQLRAECRRRLGIADDDFVIVTVANLIPYKGHADLIHGLADVRETLGPAWRVLLIGRDEGIGPSLRRQAEALGIASHIGWLGELPHPQDVLPAADLGVLPSHEEGFSNSLLEKMACGLPVVATNVGGNADAIAEGESGLLVPMRDPAALGRAIAVLRNDPGLRRKLGAAARRRVEEKFSIEACARRYLNLYGGLMRSEGPISELIDPVETDMRRSGFVIAAT